jgi:transposase-like protein
VANVTDPDSTVMKGRGMSPVQGYNAQAAVTADQIVVAAEVTQNPTDVPNFLPMTKAVAQTLRQAGHEEPVQTIVADAGYWSVENATADQGAEVLIPPSQKNFYGGHKPHTIERRLVIDRVRKGEITLRQGAEMLGMSYKWFVELVAHYKEDEGTNAVSSPEHRQAVIERVARGELSYRAAARELNLAPLKIRQLFAQHLAGLPDPAFVRETMEEKLADPANQALYNKRGFSVEPVFGNIKGNRGFRRFSRRGSREVSSEWRLICATHNLLKLWRMAPAG